MKIALPIIALSLASAVSISAQTSDLRQSPETGAPHPLTMTGTPSVRHAAPHRATDLAVDVPYTATFNLNDKLNDFTVIDANNDGYTWKYNNKEALCSYNSTNTSIGMDDWLITRPIRLEAATSYKFTATVRCADKGTVELMEVFAGNAPTIEAMTIRVMEITEVTALKPNYATVEGTFTATSSGAYYIGIHGCSEPDQWTLFIQSFTVESLGKATMPSAVTDLEAKPDPTGAQKVTISFKAPMTDADGGELSVVDFIEVNREGSLVKTFENVAPGAECSFTDDVDHTGTVTYSVAPVIGSNRGTELSATVYVGIARPAAPTGLSLVETENLGEVTLSWEAVTTNEYGHEMDPSLVTYTIIATIDNSVIASGITGTSHTFRAISEKYQTFAEYYLIASTEAGSSAAAISPVIAAGKPYSVPMELRVTSDYYLTHNIYIEGDWSIAPLSTDLDEDGFVLRLTAENGVLDVLKSGKIAIPADARHPVFTFHYYTWKTASAGPSLDTVFATINGERVEGAIFSLGESDGWRTATIPLDAYKGTTVQVGFEVETLPIAGGLAYYPLFDGFSVIDPFANDLQLKSFFVPSSIKTGNTAEITAEVRNNGANDAPAFDIELRRDGELVDTKTIDALEAGAKTSVSFLQTAEVNWNENVTYSISVNYPADENPADNTCDEQTVTILFPSYPVPYGATFDAQTDGSVLLAWEAPALNSEPETITEGFENEQPFAINDVSGWTFFDVDKSRTYAFGGGDVFPGQFSAMAYIVFDNSYFGGIADYAGHSGDKYLGSFAATSGLNDDWAISPLLSGEAQSVSFYAKSYNDKYGLETFEFLYTDKTGTLTTEDFTLVDKAVVPVTWKKYTFDIPAGARHFAIRCTSADKFFFMLDDVTFSLAPQTERFKITGYNIYRNGIRLNDSPVAELSYTVAADDSDAASYCVSAVYTIGESCLSDEATKLSAVGSIDSASIAVSVRSHTVTVTGAPEGTLVNVYTASGALSAKAVADSTGKATLTVGPGIYIIHAGTLTAKVTVF